jgi:uncharacterized protein (DUF885 family)
MFANKLSKFSTILILLSMLAASCSSPPKNASSNQEASGEANVPLVATASGGHDASGQTAIQPSEPEQSIEEFFEASYRELLLRNPELVVELGLQKRYDMEQAELTDISKEYTLQTLQLAASILDGLHSYSRGSLSTEQQISYDVYEAYLQDLLWGQEFMDSDYLVTFLITNGVQVQLLNFFTEIHPIASKRDAEDYITRLGQVQTKIDQIIDGLRARKQNGIVTPQSIYQWPLGAIRAIVTSQPEATPYYSAFDEKLNKLAGLGEQDRQDLLAQAAQTIQSSVIPAYKALANYLDEGARFASNEDSLAQFENGEAYYAYLLRHFTTTDLNAEEIHSLGLHELERIHGEMHAIFSQLGYPDSASLSNLYAQAAQDSGFVSGSQMPETYESIIRQAESNLESAFKLRPKADLVVIGGPAGDYYSPGSLDGSRPGAFFASTTSGSPRMSMATLAYHEGVPGHHFQIALAQESDLPTFRNVVDFTAYTEGWALYAERLAWELGWYKDDPYSNLGRLQAEAFRAARLVVDTGIHAQGWSFDQAVVFMVENTGLPQRMVQREVGRYIAWPGQATAYMIGLLKFLELRQEAMDQLGERFDLKEFHTVVLSNGSMPLDVLERVVQDYIDAKLAEQ